MEVIQILSVIVVVVASTIPIYFITHVKNRKVFASSIFLIAALLSYGIHTVFEGLELDALYPVFEVCFGVSILGSLFSYVVFSGKNVSGLGRTFGIIMVFVFLTWSTAELIKEYASSSASFVENVVSFVMIGFGLFIVMKFLWLRKSIYSELKNTH